MLEKLKRLKELLKLDSQQANRLWDKKLSLIFGTLQIDIIYLDDIIHQRHGNYEDKNMSLKDAILKYYGEDAQRLVSESI